MELSFRRRREQAFELAPNPPVHPQACGRQSMRSSQKAARRASMRLILKTRLENPSHFSPKIHAKVSIKVLRNCAIVLVLEKCHMSLSEQQVHQDSRVNAREH